MLGQLDNGVLYQSLQPIGNATFKGSEEQETLVGALNETCIALIHMNQTQTHLKDLTYYTL